MGEQIPAFHFLVNRRKDPLYFVLEHPFPYPGWERVAAPGEGNDRGIVNIFGQHRGYLDDLRGLSQFHLLIISSNKKYSVWNGRYAKTIYLK